MGNKCGAPNTGTQIITEQMANLAGGGKKVGDWVCRACGNLNYASRENCNKCGIPKTTFVSKSGLRPGDWVCPSCGNHNWADKQSCNKCGAPKVESAVQQQKPGQQMREGDWVCEACGNHNYANRTVCNRCNSARPSN